MPNFNNLRDELKQGLHNAFVPKSFDMEGLLNTGVGKAATIGNAVLNPGLIAGAGLMSMAAEKYPNAAKNIQTMFDASGPGAGLDDIVTAGAMAVLPRVTKLARGGAKVAGEFVRKVAPEAKAATGSLTKSLRIDPLSHTPFKIPQEMKKWQVEVFSPKQLDQLHKAKQQYPDLAKALDHMTPLEVTKVMASPETLAKMNRLVTFLPHAKEMAAAMKLGEPKQGWYAASAKAIADVFGREDAPRFAALLASTSPQTSVESNLMNSLKIWTNWDRAGRPTDPQAIKYIMGQSVQGSGTEESVLNAWVNNASRALAAPDMDKFTLSGPKVNSFFLNLIGHTRPATLDAWMSNGLAVSPKLLGGTSPSPKLLQAGDPGMSPGYSLISGRLREAANAEGISAAQGQEQYWSAAMPLYEASRKLGIDPRDFLQKGLLTPKSIRGTPDFSTLLKQGEYGNVLRQGGYEEPLSKMISHQWPDKDFSLDIGEQRQAMKLAENLSDLQGTRRRETTSRKFPGWNPEKIHIYGTRESAPGIGFGVGAQEGGSAAIIHGSPTERAGYHRDVMRNFQDPGEKDLLTSAVFPGQTLPGRSATGLYTPPFGPKQSQPMTAYGTELPLRWRKGEPSLHPGDEHALKTTEEIAGLLTMQNFSGTSGIAPHQGGHSYFVPNTGKAPTEGLTKAGETFPGKYFADTGGGVNAIEPNKQPLTEEVTGSLEGLLREPQKFDKKGNPIPPQEAFPGTTLGPHVDRTHVGAERKQGTGLLTRNWLANYDQMPAWRQKALDKALQVVAPGLHHTYSGLPAENAPPVDVMNLIGMLRDQGVKRVKEGAARGEFLPTAAAAAYLAKYTSDDSPSGERE